MGLNITKPANYINGIKFETSQGTHSIIVSKL
jgi:hypothetical protein